MRVIYWIMAIGLIVLGALGYLPELFNFRWLPITNAILLILFLLLSFGDIAITRYNEAQIERKNRKFRILAQKTIGSPQDDLKGLAWDGNNLWLTGRLSNVNGLFRLNADLKIDLSIPFEDGWAYGITYVQPLFVIKGLANKGYMALEYDAAGSLLRELPLPFEVPDAAGSLAFDGEHFWLGVDVQNLVYKISMDYKVIERYSTTHRLLGATFACNCLWLTDAYTIYQYDMSFNSQGKYQYPGTTCRGMAFDGNCIWSLDDGLSGFINICWIDWKVM